VDDAAPDSAQGTPPRRQPAAGCQGAGADVWRDDEPLTFHSRAPSMTRHRDQPCDPRPTTGNEELHAARHRASARSRHGDPVTACRRDADWHVAGRRRHGRPARAPAPPARPWWFPTSRSAAYDVKF
jgi:hypothetical protein